MPLHAVLQVASHAGWANKGRKLTQSAVIDNYASPERQQQLETETTMQEFLKSSLWQEILKLLKECTSIQVPAHSFAGPSLTLQAIPDRLYTLSVRDDEFAGSDLIEVTDEKLLERLRSVNGQFTSNGLPVFYYEHVMSTADFKVFATTGEIPKRG